MTPEELQQKTYELDLQKFAFEKERQHEEQEFETRKLVSTKAIETDKLAVKKQKAKWSTITVFVTGFSILKKRAVSIHSFSISQTSSFEKI